MTPLERCSAAIARLHNEPPSESSDRDAQAVIEVIAAIVYELSGDASVGLLSVIRVLNSADVDPWVVLR